MHARMLGCMSAFMHTSPRLPPTFYDDMKAALKERDAHEEDEEGCNKEDSQVSSSQSDSLIAKRAKDRKSQRITSPDTNFRQGLCYCEKRRKLRR